MPVSKILIATAGAGFVAAGFAAPAMAGAINAAPMGASSLFANSVLLGGVTASGDSAAYGRDYDRYRDRDQRYGDRDYGRRGDSRKATQMCTRAAERDASRHSFGRARVTDIRDVERKDGGYTVKGRIAVNSMGRSWRNGDNVYGRGWEGDYRGWDKRYRGYDSGRFTCKVRYGRVVSIDYKDIRGL